MPLNITSLSTAKKIGLLFFFFSILSVAVAIYFSTAGSGQQLKKTVAEEEIILGPLQVDKARAVYKFKFHQAIRQFGDWSSVLVEILDKNKKGLCRFSDEFWAETGRDSEGTWTERRESFTLKYTFPAAGQYYLYVTHEQNRPGGAGPLVVSAMPKKGSAILPTLLAVVLFILGIFPFFKSD